MSKEHRFFQLFVTSNDQFEIRRTGTQPKEDDVYGVFRFHDYLFSTGYKSLIGLTDLFRKVEKYVGVDIGE